MTGVHKPSPPSPPSLFLYNHRHLREAKTRGNTLLSPRTSGCHSEQSQSFRGLWNTRAVQARREQQAGARSQVIELPPLSGESELKSNIFQNQEQLHVLWLAEETSHSTFSRHTKAKAWPKTSTHTQKSHTLRSN